MRSFKRDLKGRFATVAGSGKKKAAPKRLSPSDKRTRRVRRAKKAAVVVGVATVATGLLLSKRQTSGGPRNAAMVKTFVAKKVATERQIAADRKRIGSLNLPKQTKKKLKSRVRTYRNKAVRVSKSTTKGRKRATRNLAKYNAKKRKTTRRR